MPDGSGFPPELLPASRSLASDPWLRLPQVEQEVGLTRSTIYRWIALKRFPAGVGLTGGQRRWPMSEILAWKAEQARSGQATSCEPCR